jgi:DHA1 family bicyclomycin/chloramphenicol resistance-like MFS transporter
MGVGVNEQTVVNKWKNLILLTPLVLLLSLAMDIYVPAIPELINTFKTDPPHIQSTLSLFLLIFSFTQLLVGPLSDQYGRRRPAIISALIFILGSLLAVFISNISELLACRVIQSVGACGCYVIAFAIVRDQFDGDKSAELFSYINAIIAISPIFGPVLGSVLDIHFGWQAEFVALGIMGIWAFISLIIQKETLSPKDRVPVAANIFNRYLRILLTKSYLAYVFSAGVAMAYLFTFFSMSPYIILTILRLPEKNFGFYFAFMGVAVMIGSIIGAQMVVRVGNEKSLYIGHFIALLGGALLLVWYFIYGTTIYGFVIPMLPIGIGATITLGAAVSSALEPFKEWSGSAAALLGFIQFIIASIVGTLAVGYSVGSTLPLGVSAIILSPLTIIILFIVKDK